MTGYLNSLELCLDWPSDAAEPAIRALRFAATIAQAQGARVLVRSGCEMAALPAYCAASDAVADAGAWVALAPATRVVLSASRSVETPKPGHVMLDIEPWHSEATLFAATGLADLNGSPDGPPLVPNAHYAAHTIGFAVYTALIGVHASAARFGKGEQARVDGLAVLKWINWKAVAGAAMGMRVTRTGAMAEWPVLACKDGHVAILFTERDWPAMIKMVDEEALKDPRFESFEGREEHRAEYLPILQDWCLENSKEDIRTAMATHEIPGDSVRTIGDMLECPLFDHRESFVQAGTSKLPRLPERVLAETEAARAKPAVEPETGDLPLAGLRVLDLGIITAGAGVGALLADMGAEVLKVESETYPDPFRQWAGSSDSPLFRFNNRNKYGLGIDLKTEDGKAQFLEMVAGADIVLENFRRGVIERLGLGFDTLSNANPAILLASISGQGNDGPGTHTSTFGSTLEANAGFATLTRDAAGQPYVTGRPLNFPDQVICLYGAGVTAAAALNCRKTGQGQHLDISQRDTVLYQIGDVIHWVTQGNSEAPESLTAGLGKPMVDAIYACADGAYVALSLPKGSSLETALGADADDLKHWALSRDAESAVSAFRSAGFGAVKALDGKDLSKDASLFASGIFGKDPDGNIVKGFPFQFSETPMSIHSSAPKIGQHNELLLKSRC